MAVFRNDKVAHNYQNISRCMFTRVDFQHCPGLRNLKVACCTLTGLSLYESSRRRDGCQNIARGRIDRPVEGWISLEEMDGGFRLVRPTAPTGNHILLHPVTVDSVMSCHANINVGAALRRPVHIVPVWCGVLFPYSCHTHVTVACHFLNYARCAYYNP